MGSLPLQVMMNKENTKVVFAEANLDFVNVLLSFLAVSLGKLQHSGISLGSINTLYSSLSDMDVSYFCMPGCKEMLLNPRSSLGEDCRKLALDITHSPPNRFYICQDKECPKLGYSNVSMYSGIAICDCGKPLSREILLAESPEGGGFINKPSSFIITDDLHVVPVLTGIFQTLSDLGITLPQGASMKSVAFDIYKMKALLYASFTSANPLTDVRCDKTWTSATITKVEPAVITLEHIPKQQVHSRKIVLKLFLQKSTNKFLYAEATDEFVELLIKFVALPLGGVEFFLGGKTDFKNIDNLYRSVSNGIDDKCFRTPDEKSSLTNPKLPHGSTNENQFLHQGLCYSTLLTYNVKYNCEPVIKNITFHVNSGYSLKFKKSKELYVKKHSKFIVTDDLKVSPTLVSSILILSGLGISLSDVEEVEFSIGQAEALSILKSCLTSKTVLSDVFMLNKVAEVERKPKQEP